VGHLSKFGLLELSRQRLRPTAEVSAYTQCPACHGRGRVKRVDSMGLSLLRQISFQVAQNPIQEVRAIIPLEVGIFLLNNKRKEILDLEEYYNLKIMITPQAGLGPEDFQVEYLKREAAEAKPAPEVKPAAEAKAAPESKSVAEAKPAAAAKSRRSSSSRRRGPRKSTAAKKAAAEAPEASETTPFPVDAPEAAVAAAPAAEPLEAQASSEPQETLVPHPEPHTTEESS
jgi:ribonuclease E